MEDYKIKSKLRRSTIKQKILELIKEEPKTASDLAKILNKHREPISRALLDMKKDKLVKCMNPEDPNYRYYKKI